jgi:hypothetical protein
MQFSVPEKGRSIFQPDFAAQKPRRSRPFGRVLARQLLRLQSLNKEKLRPHQLYRP